MCTHLQYARVCACGMYVFSCCVGMCVCVCSDGVCVSLSLFYVACCVSMCVCARMVCVSLSLSSMLRVCACCVVASLVGPTDYVTSTYVHNAIPQFPVDYWEKVRALTASVSRLSPHLHIASPFMHGVSVNDCISYSKHTAARYIHSLLAQAAP